MSRIQSYSRVPNVQESEDDREPEFYQTSITYDEIAIYLQNDVKLNQQKIYKLEKLFQAKNYGYNTFRDELCQVLGQNDNDKKIQIYVMLFDKLGIGSKKRQKIYDILLHKYFEVKHLNVENIKNISETFIKQLKLNDIIDTKTFVDIVAEKALNGEKIMALNARQFATLFKSMNLSAKNFRKLYMKFKKWEPKDYSMPIKFDAISQTLKTHKIILKRAEDEKYEEEEEEDEEEVKIAQLFESVINEENEIEYDEESLRDELCQAFGHMDEDENLIIYKVFEKLNKEYKERQQIYDVLLHGYFKVTDLNVDNIKNISETIIREVKLENIIEPKTFISIIEDKHVDGEKLMDLKNARKFANLFKTMDASAKVFTKIYMKFKKWKPNDYSKIHKEQKQKQQKEKPKQQKEEKKEKDDIVDKEQMQKYLKQYNSPIHHCRQTEIDTDQDPLPKYIYKSLYYRSDDETLEVLLDTAVLTALQCELWDKKEFIYKIYDDINYPIAVTELYEEIGGNDFFNQFVRDYAKRELEIWKIKTEDSYKVEENQIFNIIQKNNFKDFDVDESKTIDEEEFVQYFQEQNILIDEEILKDVFNQIDSMEIQNGKITPNEYNLWKQKLIQGQINIKEEENQNYNGAVYWNRKQKQYKIYNINYVTKQQIKNYIRITDHIEWNKQYSSTIKWAVFVPKLKTYQQRQNFAKLHMKSIGYWQIISEDRNEDQRPNCIKYEELPQKHLDLIFQLLHYYYMVKIDPTLKNNLQNDNFILKQVYIDNDELIKLSNKQVMICIEDCEYELVWWNKKGKYEPNAVTIINHSAHAKRVKNAQEKNKQYSKEPIELSYIRFKPIELSNIQSVKWEWYDNDASMYKPMAAFKNDDNETEYHQPLLNQLEIAFLANAGHNFDKSIFHNQFNTVWMPQLSYFVEHKLKLSNKSDAYVFVATFNASNIMINIEQKGLTFAQENVFPRNLRRMVNGRDSLLTYARDAELFIERWKQSYNLYTGQQQKFFFSCVLAVATSIKYIDIEFMNQIVLIPLGDPLEKDEYKDDVLMELIDVRDAKKDSAISMYNKGCIIPPEDNWNVVNNSLQQICKSDILYEVEREDKGNVKETRWIQRLTNPGIITRDADSVRLFTAQEATFLRCIECIRKYILEYEVGDTLHTLWPWYRNTFYSFDNNVYKDNNIYNSLLIKYNFSHKFGIDSMKRFLEENWEVKDPDDDKWYEATIVENSNKDDEFGEWIMLEYVSSHNFTRRATHNKNSSQIRTVDAPSIRHKRKNAALQLLNVPDIERNLNIIKYQLNLCLDDMINDVFLSTLNDKERNDKSFHRIYKQKWENDEDDMLKDINRYKYKHKWAEKIKDANLKFQEKLKIENKDQLFGEDLENIYCLDITKYEFPFFEQFVCELFVNSDDIFYVRNKDNFMGVKDGFYRMFIEDWRDVPNWYRYHHDTLLLELVLRNGINIQDMINDLDGDKSMAYKLRLNNSDDFSNLIHKSYFHFKTWCQQRINVLYRLKYISNIIVQNLQQTEYLPSIYQIRLTNTVDEPETHQFDGNSQIFSKYQTETHQIYVEEAQKPKFKLDLKSDPSSQSTIMPRNTIINPVQHDDSDDDIDIYDKDEKQSPKDEKDKPLYRTPDPFLSRNIDNELLDTLQSFDLMIYGKPLALFIIDQLKTEEKLKTTFFKVLGTLFNCLPYPIVKEVVDLEKDFLQYAQPDILRELCMNVIHGTHFKPSAALGIAEFFDDLSDQDIVQRQIWKDISSEFEKIASDEIDKIESNHLLLLLLTAPITTQQGKPLICIALEQRRLKFLNSERIANVMKHPWCEGYLAPTDEITTKSLSWSQLLDRLVSSPFRFYLTGQGYHWVNLVLFFMYLAFLYVYAFLRPLSGDLVDESTRASEITLWVCNFGYIVFELSEATEKGIAGYFNLGVKGQTNLMDSVICVIWLILFSLRAELIIHSDRYNAPENCTPVESAYVFLFGLQIALITLRSLEFFSGSEIFGTLIRIIKLMFFEIFKFMFIYVIVMVGCLFGLWFIVFTSHPDIDLDTVSLSAGFIYMFQVFIGTGDLEPIESHGISVVFMIFVTIVGTLILTNLLIALMTTEYENVSEQAEQEVVFNQTELTFDLSKRSRSMTLPLNIIVLIFAIIVWFINLFIAIIYPKWNIYSYLHYETFEILRLRKYWFGYPLFFTVALWITFIVGMYYYKKIAIIFFICLTCCWILHFVYLFGGFNCCQTCKVKPTKYFKLMKRKQVCQWYCNGIKLYFRESIGWCCRWCCRCRKCQRMAIKKRLIDQERLRKIREKQKIHHKGCHAELILHSHDAKKSLYAVDGKNMTQYMEEYEQNGHKIGSEDKSLMKMLTTESLFCSKCFKPFEKNKIDQQLVYPFAALLDFLSAFIFVFFPLAWFPLVLIFSLLTLKDKLFKWFQDAEEVKYTNQNFDAEYFPKQNTK